MARVIRLAGLVAVAMFIGGVGSASAQASGETVYAAQKCSMCHALDGKGQAKGPLDGVGSQADRRRNPPVDRRPGDDDQEGQRHAQAAR